LDGVPKDLIRNDKFPPKAINDDPVTQFDSSQQTDHDKPYDSGNASDFLNELSNKFALNENSLLINTTDEMRTISDSLEALNNGKSNDWCRVNDTVNEVSMQPDDEKSLRAMTDDDIAICSDKVSSFENGERNRDAANATEIDCSCTNRG
jgi:hypothetical protein